MRRFIGRVRRAFWKVLFWIFIALLALLLAGTVAAGIPWAIDENSVDRRLAAISDVVGGATLVLAVMASAVALLAYYQSLRRPRVALEAMIGNGQGGMVLGTQTHQSGNWKEVVVSPHSVLHITLVSKNDVSARNPAVSVSFISGLGTGLPYAGGSWSPRNRPDGILSVQWDGGANYLVHGGWHRQVPPLDLGYVRLTDMNVKQALIKIEWVADGFSTHESEFTVKLH